MDCYAQHNSNVVKRGEGEMIVMRNLRIAMESETNGNTHENLCWDGWQERDPPNWRYIFEIYRSAIKDDRICCAYC